MNCALYEKSGGAVWDVLLVCQLFITLTTSLLNMAAFYSAFISLVILVAVKVIACLGMRKA